VKFCPENITYQENVSEINYSYSDLTSGFCWYSNSSGEWNSTYLNSGQHFTNTISKEGSNIWTLYCNDSFGFQNYTNITFFRDTNFPLIDYGEGTEEDGTNFSRNWIFVNVTVNDTNEANITFTLVNETNVLYEYTYAAGTRNINFTDLSDSVYYYNITVTDLGSSSNTTETRQIRLDNTQPNVILNTPENDTYSNQTSQNLTVNLSDEWLGNSTLYVWNETTQINQTTTDVSGTQLALGIIYEFFYDGIFRWFYRAYDAAGNSVLSENNTFTLDRQYPIVSFGGGTEDDGTSKTEDWIYVNISINETNFANLTYELYNETDGRTLVNKTTYNSLVYEINWTNLNNDTVNYYYNVTVYDKAGNFNSTETRNILLGNSPPQINIIYPENITYQENVSEINYSYSDLTSGFCWYSNSSG
jgi:hypothetical protein